MSERAVTRMSVDEFLEWQLRQDQNYELVDGIPVLPAKAMTGATQRHDRVTVNIIRELGNQLRKGPCRPSTDDIALVTARRNVRRPDITVQCAEADPKGTTAVEPRVVIEVLSPSTLTFDRFRKLDEYKATPAIQAILLVDTEVPRVTLHERSGSLSPGEPATGAAGWRDLAFTGLDAIVALPMIAARLALADIYEGVHEG